MKCQSCNDKDKEIYTLNNRIKAIIATQKTLLIQKFQDGLHIGLEQSKQTIKEFAQVKEDYLNENERLTNLILSLEGKIEGFKNEDK